jgi:hypothetical protein
MVRDQEYSNNLQTEDNLNESIQNAVPTISPTELQPLNTHLCAGQRKPFPAPSLTVVSENLQLTKVH